MDIFLNEAIENSCELHAIQRAWRTNTNESQGNDNLGVEALMWYVPVRYDSPSILVTS